MAPRRTVGEKPAPPDTEGDSQGCTKCRGKYPMSVEVRCVLDAAVIAKISQSGKPVSYHLNKRCSNSQELAVTTYGVGFVLVPQSSRELA